MMRLRLACVLGVTALFALVQGCSTATPPPQEEEESGEETPGDDDDGKGDDDDAPPATGTPAPTDTTKAPPPADTGPPPPPPPPPKSEMTFFVTSTTFTGNLGGLAGADAKCTELAKTVNGGDHTWVAYVSTNANNGGTLVNAKDRIGPGPWKNQAKKVIAADLVELHKNDLALGPDVLDEKGVALPPAANQRYVYTGTQAGGVTRNNNCQNWTSAANNVQGGLGDGGYTPTANPVLGASWFFAKQPDTVTCNNQRRLFCFAKD